MSNSRPKPRWKQRWISGCLLIGLPLVLVGIAAHPLLLSAAARLWVMDDPDGSSDIAVIPGGQIATRPAGAARLYLEGRCPRIFVMREDENPLLHADTPGDERSRFVVTLLEDAGVAPESIFLSRDRVTNTLDEAGQFRLWLESLPKEQRPVSATLVTDAFHSRRALSAFRKANPTVDFSVVTVPHRKYTIDQWWKTAEGRADFRSEILKYLVTTKPLP